MADAFQERLRQAWSLRASHRLPECLSSLAALRREAGFSSDPSSQTETSALLQASGERALATLVLSASLARALGQLARSQELLGWIETAAAQTQLQPLPHRLYLEKGLNLFLHGRYAEALDLFLSARHGGEDLLTELQALGNLVLCFENLGLDAEPLQTELEKFIDSASADPSHAVFRDAINASRSQIQAYHLRRLFHRGEIKQLLAEAERTDSRRLEQGRQFAQWVTSLPYTTSHAPHAASAGDLLLDGGYPLFRSYRFRTLQGIVHPEDQTPARASEKIDRLYLWTWKWACDPQAFPISRLAPLLEDTWLKAHLPRLTAEDRLLLRNSLLLLGLFDPKSSQRLTALLGSIEAPPLSLSPLLEFEYLMLHHLQALRDSREEAAEDSFKLLRAHPLWKSRELRLRELLDAAKDGSKPGGTLSKLGQAIRQLIGGASRTASAGLRINPTHSELVDESGRKSVSEPLARAFELLEDHGTVSCEEFASRVFGLHRYDSLVHQMKIFNLLARMRRLLPRKSSLELKVKAGFVVAEGSWAGIQVQRDSGPAAELKNRPEWRALIQASLQIRPEPGTVQGSSRSDLRAAAELFADKKAVGRQDLERALGNSRSTITRLLNDWTQKGWILPSGKARATRYSASPAFEALLAQEKERNPS